MSNPHRGEVSVDIGPQTYSLKLTFSSLVAIETKTGDTILTLAKRFAENSYSASDVLTVLQAAEGTPDAVESYLLQDGLTTHAETCVALLGKALLGDSAPAAAEEAPSPAGKP